MKVAIMLTGLNRAKMSYFINHKNIIDKYNADVYISTYESEKIDGYLSLDEVIQLYNPKKIEIEDYNILDPQFQEIVEKIQWRDYQINKTFRWIGTKPSNVCSMYYKIKKGFEMITEPYDIYVRMRFDSTFDNLQLEENDFLNLPTCGKHSGESDQIAYGNYDNMSKYCSVYDKLYEYVLNGGEFHSETIVKNLNDNIKHQNITYYLNLTLNVIN